MSKRKRLNPKRRHNQWALQQLAQQDADPELDGDGLHPIVESSSDIALINQLLADEDWEIPGAAKHRVPVELTRLALAEDKVGKHDPTISPQTEVRAAQALIKIDDHNTTKCFAAIKALQSREAMSKQAVANDADHVQVVVYIPERAPLEEFEWHGDDSADGNGQAKRIP